MSVSMPRARSARQASAGPRPARMAGVLRGQQRLVDDLGHALHRIGIDLSDEIDVVLGPVRQTTGQMPVLRREILVQEEYLHVQKIAGASSRSAATAARGPL